jgi:uncharacterized protein (TIGR00375 family)
MVGGNHKSFMKYIADLHVHSKFSRATAKNLDLENLYIAAQIKGVKVVGTGDFTYPGWFSEISEKLVPSESGLFKLKNDLARICDEQVPKSCRADVRFILSTEISNIYKKNKKTRKNHNLILVPDLQVAEKFSAKLNKIGNIKSDGRPILGLDARDLLEILMEISEEAFLIPAHIWTPWFSVLGSKSGFNSIEECFEDLSPHIFAVETGLSSDPPMNWRVSGLDGLTLVSNSDAHSPFNLGREANLLDTQLSYAAIKRAIKNGDSKQFLGTFEFYPEEGKYHLDGHRKCNTRLKPKETMDNDGKCPVCGKDLTIGVLYRVEELADRKPGQKPKNCHPYYSIVQLVDILSEIFKVGPKSKKVIQNYQLALAKLGSEFEILHFLEPDVLDRAGIPLLGEAIRRMRHKKIDILPGYDGEYGRVRIFKANEHDLLMGQKVLFSSSLVSQSEPKHTESDISAPSKSIDIGPVKNDFESFEKFQKQTKPILSFNQLNRQQHQAVECPDGALLIIAGPGTGKTHTLTQRIAYLITEKKVPTQHILAVTFTNKAAQEMRDRLNAVIGDRFCLPLAATFHALCYQILNDQKEKPIGIIDEDHRKALISEAMKKVPAAGRDTAMKPGRVLDYIVAAKQQILRPDEFAELHCKDPKSSIVAEIYQVYQQLLSIQELYDFEDLLFNVVRLFESWSNVCRQYQRKFQHIFIDEYQDLNQAQYRIVRALAPDTHSVKNLCVIGDPDQSIYGFRGSDVKYFHQFSIDYPDATLINLTRNYRSTQTILKAAFQIIEQPGCQSADSRTYSKIEGVRTISILELTTEKAEAKTISRIIEEQIGGTGFHSIDTGVVKDANLVKERSYSDFAVLYRTHDQHRIIAEVFEKSGIPFQIVSRESVLTQEGVSELIVFLKVIEGIGGFIDHQKLILFAIPGFGKKALDRFNGWCYRNQFSLQEGLRKAARFPVYGLPSSKQQLLNAFSKQILQYQTDMSSLTVTEKLRYLKKNTKLSDRLNKDVQIKEAFANLIELARQFDTNTTDFLATIALHTDTDAFRPNIEKVSLMTMHAAKGLEFPVVFIAGCEDNLIPFKRFGVEHADVNEERRLLYVAMTRAMESLYLTRAKKRRIYGKLEDRLLSPFVDDIENHLKSSQTPFSKKKKKAVEQVQLKLFS